MTNSIIKIAITGICLFFQSGLTHAQLLSVPQSFPDVSLNNPYLLYDSDAIDSETGLLRIVAFGSTLNEGEATGNSSVSQQYVSANDLTPDVMLSIAINRMTGQWAATNNPIANRVTINYGNSNHSQTAQQSPQFRWEGVITDFGYSVDNPASKFTNESGHFFNARWEFSQDNYKNMPQTLNQFIDNTLTRAMSEYQGGIKVSNSAGFSPLDNSSPFNRDWIFGTNAQQQSIQTMLSPYINDFKQLPCDQYQDSNCVAIAHSSVSVDSFISTPIPPAFWLWGGALISLIPTIKRRAYQPGISS